MSTISETIATLFGGVSRQPPQVRQPSQLQEQVNALSSVITGGFEKRPGTGTIAKLSALDVTKSYKVHGIDRSETEQDFVLFQTGATPAIFAYSALTGANKVVTIGDTIHTFFIDAAVLDSTVSSGVVQVDGADFTENLAMASSETQFVWTWESSDATTMRFKVEGSADGSVWNDIATAKGGAASGTFNTTIAAVVTGDHDYIKVTVTTSAADAVVDTLSIRATFADMTYLKGTVRDDIKVTSVADYTFITNRQKETRMEALGSNPTSGTITGTKNAFADLPAASGSGNTWRIRGSGTDGFGTYYVKDNATTDWIEVVDPTTANTFDESRMPHQLVRASDGGSYTFSAATWESRPSGDATLNPVPGYIGGKINDVSFYRNRLVFASDETVYLSQSGDVFNMWAQKATAVLDSDPIERGATTNSVNILQYATVFRKFLFLSSAQAQFELDSGERSLSPETAVMNQSTTFRSSTKVKPVSMGDVLFFGSKTEGSAIVYEYAFQDNTFSNTAVDVTRHIKTYIPNEVFEMHTDSASSTMVVVATEAQNKVFIYRTFFDGPKKLQSAWSEYTFGSTAGDGVIHGMSIFGTWLYLVIERNDGNMYIEWMPIEREAVVTDMPFMPLLDQRELLTGVYVSSTDLTTWTSTYEHLDDTEVVLGPDGLIPGRTLQVSYIADKTKTTAVGDHSAGAAYVGRMYTMTVELSKIYAREENSPVLTGRLQLMDLTVVHEKSGYYEVKITPDGGRASSSYKFEGKTLGKATLAVNEPSIEETGVFGHLKVLGRARDTRVEFINGTPEPSVITSVQWRGFFNDTGRTDSRR